MSAGEYRNWTPEEDKRLLELRGSGLTFAEVSERMSRSFKGVKARYYLITGAEYLQSRVRAEKKQRKAEEAAPFHSFMNPYAGEMIGRAKARVEKLVRAGTDTSAAVQQVYQETGVRLSPDNFTLRPAGEAAHRLLKDVMARQCTA